MGFGMNETTGEWLTGVPEVRQRIQRLLRTRRGSIPLRRNYGSDLPRLVDGKVNALFKVHVYAEVADALADPANGLTEEFSVTRMGLAYNSGILELTLEGNYLIDGSNVVMDGVQI